MKVSSQIFKISEELAKKAKECPDDVLDPLELAANEAGNAWSGSWLGYHSRVYYKDLQPVPPGARFSKEWGFEDMMSNGTRGEWMEYDFDGLVSDIKRAANLEDLSELKKEALQTKEFFEEAQSNLLSLLAPIAVESDQFFNELVKKIEKEKPFSRGDYIQFSAPSGQQMSRDMNAIQAGSQSPPHIGVLGEAFEVKSPYACCQNLAKWARRAASHIENLSKKEDLSARIGTNVFFGHGRSSVWKDLKDFIQDRLSLPWDEFNRVPVAGVTNIARLSEMLDTAAVAFIVLTAEDEQADGKLHARMNVIHEAGLFQGRLGFTKAILLLEEGCEEFSNVQGLGQIRFPKGNISAKFEEIRQVLEREKLLE